MDMEILDITDHKEVDGVENSMEIRPPNEALFLAIAYLPLFELLSLSQVCRSLRHAVKNDILPWLDIVVKKPLNSRITDDILMKITSKGNGRLRTLALINCVKITDDGLHQVIEKNPLISKLFVPGCTGLTPDGVVNAVKTLTKHNHNLISLEINGIYNITKQLLKTLHSTLRSNQRQQDQQMQHMIFYHDYNQTSKHKETGRAIDIDICPKCDQARMVFDCPKKNCGECCRGCCYCVPRCVECGICVETEEVGDAASACADTLCLDCWIRLPKCNFCNMPYCNQHAEQRCCLQGSTGFVCDACHLKSLQSSDD